MNTTSVSEEKTARTQWEVGAKRANYLAHLGVARVLELCVGPSLRTLEQAYGAVGIEVIGNDIDPRWVKYHPQGKWLIGDAFEVEWDVDAVVFAPPLSRGCTGKRVDSLMIPDVTPGYDTFLDKWLSRPGPQIGVLVLPGRSLATKWDRRHFYQLRNRTYELGLHETHLEMKAGSRQIRKYVDMYLERVNE